MVHVLYTTQNLAISRCCCCCCRQRTAEKCSKNYNAQPLFCSLNLLFSDVPVAVKLPSCLLKFRNSLFSTHTVSTLVCFVYFCRIFQACPNDTVTYQQLSLVLLKLCAVFDGHFLLFGMYYSRVACYRTSGQVC